MFAMKGTICKSKRSLCFTLNVKLHIQVIINLLPQEKLYTEKKLIVNKPKKKLHGNTQINCVFLQSS